MDEYVWRWMNGFEWRWIDILGLMVGMYMARSGMEIDGFLEMDGWLRMEMDG